VMVSVTVGAAAQVALPPWLASILQVPAWLKVTVLPDTEHTPVPLLESRENETGRPEVAVADRVTGSSPTVTEVGYSPTVIVWGFPLTAIFSWAWGAAAQVALPGWLASMMQVPATA